MEQTQGFSWIRGKTIGAGSFGTVSLAVNRSDGSLFAVKSVELAEHNGSEIAALENERQILESVDCPQIIRCLGGGDSAASPSGEPATRNVFLEYMPGGSLADLMAKLGGKLDESLVRIYTRGILLGLAYLHSRGIVHCDVKGKNVLVGCETVKLADFGAAKWVSEVPSTVPSSTIKGTPLWMAPEAARQEEQGTASDIWSLGCTVIEMLTGKAPWGEAVSGSSPMVAMYRIACSNDVPELPSCVSSQGTDFLAKCLCRDPSSRASAQELLRHPFVTGEVAAVETDRLEVKLPVVATPRSPRSPLDFSRFFSIKSSSSSSSSSSTAAATTTSSCEMAAAEEAEVKWIVVRSPQGKTPRVNAFEHLSDFAEEMKEQVEAEEEASAEVAKFQVNSAGQESDSEPAPEFRSAQEPKSDDLCSCSQGSAPLFLGEFQPLAARQDGGFVSGDFDLSLKSTRRTSERRRSRSGRSSPRLATVPRSRGRMKQLENTAGGISTGYPFPPDCVVTSSLLKDTGTNFTLKNRVNFVSLRVERVVRVGRAFWCLACLIAPLISPLASQDFVWQQRWPIVARTPSSILSCSCNVDDEGRESFFFHDLCLLLLVFFYIFFFDFLFPSPGFVRASGGVCFWSWIPPLRFRDCD